MMLSMCLELAIVLNALPVLSPLIPAPQILGGWEDFLPFYREEH